MFFKFFKANREQKRGFAWAMKALSTMTVEQVLEFLRSSANAGPMFNIGANEALMAYAVRFDR